MITLQTVKDDLKEIRYFFAHQQIFNDPRVSVSDKMQEKISKYNEAVSLAEPRMYAVYVGLYLQDNTQRTLATEWGFSENYIYKLNNRLCEYLVKYFTNCANKVTGKGEKK